MRNLDNNTRVDEQLWPDGMLHIFNVSDEIVTGDELSGKKADVGGVSTSSYKLRSLATLNNRNLMLCQLI